MANEELAFDHRTYVPILLTRQGELLALREASAFVKDAMVPMFVIHPIPRDLDTHQPQRTLDDHFERLLLKLQKGWGYRPAFVDVLHVAGEAVGDVQPLVRVVAEAALRGLRLTPVLRPGLGGGALGAARTLAEDHERGVCLRLPSSFWAEFGSPTGDGRLAAFLSDLNVSAAQCHLVLDVGGEVADPPALTAAALRGVLRSLPFALAWRSLTVSGTSMPDSTSRVGTDKAVDMPRNEWKVWAAMMDSPEVRRKPSFGDYGIQHPDPGEGFDPRMMDSSAQIRYTVPNSWLIARGGGARRRGNEQVRRLARIVVEDARYAGKDFSWGDDWLFACAGNKCEPGNQSVWRKVGTNHHLAQVVSEVANLVGS